MCVHIPPRKKTRETKKNRYTNHVVPAPPCPLAVVGGRTPFTFKSGSSWTRTMLCPTKLTCAPICKEEKGTTTDRGGFERSSQFSTYLQKRHVCILNWTHTHGFVFSLKLYEGMISNTKRDIDNRHEGGYGMLHPTELTFNPKKMESPLLEESPNGKNRRRGLGY